jgi:5-methylcytosine-specific restriction endonuclease McrA
LTFIAIRDFVDPSDGSMVVAGRTHVHPSADVARSHPENFRPASRKLGPITRVRGSVSVADRPRQRAGRTGAELDHFGHPSSAVEIRARSTEPRPFTVSLTPYSRQQILDEILHIRRQWDLEAVGWMWACQRPRDWSDSLTVALATHAGDSRHARNGKCRECERDHERNRSASRRARSSMAWQKARAAARRRGGQRCTICASSEDLEVHHIAPLSEGGDRFALTNLTTLCADCHRATGKGAPANTARQPVTPPPNNPRKKRRSRKNPFRKWKSSGLTTTSNRSWADLDSVL